jgi:hypothetical protein
MPENAALRQQRPCVMLHIKGHNRVPGLSAELEPNDLFQPTDSARPLPVTKPYRAHPRFCPHCNWLCSCANQSDHSPSAAGVSANGDQSIFTSRSLQTEPLNRRLINKSSLSSNKSSRSAQLHITSTAYCAQFAVSPLILCRRRGRHAALSIDNTDT